MLDALYSNLAQSVSAQFGAPYHDATASWPGEPVTDDGGTITSPGDPVTTGCKVQISGPTEAMRQAEGFLQTDMRLLVLSTTLARQLDTQATIEVMAGPHVGVWRLLSVGRDPAGIGYNCAGRKA